MLEFKKYERAESTLETEGRVIDLIGKDGSIDLIPKNLKDTSKRVVVILRKKNGTSVMVSCSKQVSDGIRDKSITVGQLMGFEILKGESDIPFISLPGGGQLVTIQAKNVKVVEYEPTAVNSEDLIAL